MPLFHRHSRPRNYKCWEFDVDLWSFEHGIHWLIIAIETRHRTDHGGLFITLVILNLKTEFNFHDVRHWNRSEGRYDLESEDESP
jgi:hypothetical protein